MLGSHARRVLQNASESVPCVARGALLRSGTAAHDLVRDRLPCIPSPAAVQDPADARQLLRSGVFKGMRDNVR